MIVPMLTDRQAAVLRARYIQGIAAYAEQQRVIKQVIAAYGGALHQDDFDKEFSGRNRRWPVVATEGHTFILGTPGGGCANRWLDLAQNMVRAGLMTIKGKLPNVRYCLLEETR